jgi:16S rRNA G1207 methylase RsmC
LPLQAWDAADEYLLSESATKNAGAEARVLIVNDQFGALATALNCASICSWSDSHTAHCATLDNFERNRLDTAKLILSPSTQIPAGPFDLVLWRIPKTQALFQQQIQILQTCVDPGTRILVGGMQKHLPPRAHELLRRLGDVDVLPGKKKARVFALRLEHNHAAAPSNDERALAIEEYGLRLQAGPNVFARDAFDIGARFFLAQFERLPRAPRIADLGCGNGILGLRAKQLQPWASVDFFDESYQAVAAARKNYAANDLDQTPPLAAFHTDDIFSRFNGAPFDLILCNPPFHQAHVIGDHIARQMFAQSRKHLTGGGELWIVGNRHLDYHIQLKKIFGNCRQIAANAKFVVLAASKI